MKFKGKVALVTGSTSGIGLGIARTLAAEGAAVALNSYTDSPDDHALAASLAAETGAELAYFRADMSKADQCRAWAHDVVTRFGGLDILVNNAGIQHVDPIEAFPVATWDAIIAINLSSAFHTTAVAPRPSNRPTSPPSTGWSG